MGDKRPTVSVIVPVYNRVHLLPRAVNSVLNQTYRDFEIIVVDDGSTDNVKEVVEKLQKKDERIRYIRHEKNKGAGAARNTGIEAARGRYIAFQDSDDEWLPEKLEKQIKAFENVSSIVGVVYSKCLRLKEGKKIYAPFSWIKQKEGNIHKEFLKENFINTPMIIVRKECFEKAGKFDETLPRLQDWELVLRLSKYYHFKYIDEVLSIAHTTTDSISANQDALIKALMLILDKHLRDFKTDKKSLAKHLCLIGDLLCQRGDLDQGRDYLFKALKFYPLNIKCLIEVFTSLLGQEVYSKFADLKRRLKREIKK